MAVIHGVVLAVLLAWSTAMGSGPVAAVDPAEALIEELMCPTTGHYEPLATAKTADAAWMRGFIRAKFAEGWPRQRVVDTLVRQYGEGILPVPPKQGFSLAAWIMPLASILGGVAIVGFVLTRWLRERQRHDAYIEAEMARDLDESDMRRYEAQLARDLEQFE